MVIVGGGIHGVHLAHSLLHKTQMTHDDIRIIDPHEELLHEWYRCARNCGMTHLRSSSVHHIDIHPFSLFRWASRKSDTSKGDFIHPKRRPSLEVFNTHCRMVIEDNQLDSLHTRSRALRLIDNDNSVTVVTDKEVIKTRYVLLAIGFGEQPLWPIWAKHLKERGAHIHHVFDPDLRLDGEQLPGPVAVIGAGISGGHLCLKIAKSTGENVSLISRKDLVISNFDFAPGWIGPRFTEDFYRLPIDQRRQKIIEARAKGSVPEDLKIALDKSEEEGLLNFIKDNITDVRFTNGCATLTGEAGQYPCKTVLLATGFEEKRPGGEFIDQVIGEFDLHTATCGFPVAAPSLQWHQRIFVTGPLSELQLGPIARNIVGARQASKRIVNAVNAVNAVNEHARPF